MKYLLMFLVVLFVVSCRAESNAERAARIYDTYDSYVQKHGYNHPITVDYYKDHEEDL